MCCYAGEMMTRNIGPSTLATLRFPPENFPSSPVCLLLQGLNHGGAERQAVLLAVGLARRGIPVTVVTFKDGGALAADLQAAQIPIVAIGKRGRWDLLRFGWRLARTLRRMRPSVLYAFLPIPNLTAILVKPLIPGMGVVWGIRGSERDMSRYDPLIRWTWSLQVPASRFADRIVANSVAGYRHFAARGLSTDKMRVILNGIDTRTFRADPRRGREARTEWGVDHHTPLIGLIAASFDPRKGHRLFLEAAARLLTDCPRLTFVCVGGAPGPAQAELDAYARALGIAHQVVWAGDHRDMVAVHSALDVLVLPSESEGFPNVVGEAMACGVPCVTTRVGDCADIVDAAGIVIDSATPAALATAIDAILSLDAAERATLGRRARQRMESNYSPEQLVDRTLEVLAEIRPRKRGRLASSAQRGGTPTPATPGPDERWDR